MMNKVICCDECFASIGKRSTSAAKMWLELCALKVESGVFGLRTNDLPETRVLEVMGFITTSEFLNGEEGMFVKVNGEKHNYFCRGRCNGRD